MKKVELEAIAKVINDLDFYRVLKVPAHASESEIRASFHREALNLHPDQYAQFKTSDPEIIELAKNIYSRIIEAYRTLSNSERRAEYDKSLKTAALKASAPSRYESFEDTDENEITSVRRREVTSTTSAGIKFFKLAQAAYQKRDYNSARMNIQIALNTDKENPEFLDLLHRIDSEIAKRKPVTGTAKP